MKRDDGNSGNTIGNTDSTYRHALTNANVIPQLHCNHRAWRQRRQGLLGWKHFLSFIQCRCTKFK